MPPAAGGNLLKVGFADVNPGIPGVTPMIIDGVGAPGVVVEDPGTVEVAAEKESSKFILYVVVRRELLKVGFILHRREAKVSRGDPDDHRRGSSRRSRHSRCRSRERVK